MITAADLWQVSYTVAGIAAAAAVAGMIVLRLLAARSVATSVAVVAAVTVVATLAGVCVISLEMFIARKDLDVILAVVAVAGIAGFTVALLLGRRVSAASRLLLSAVREVGQGGGYRPPSSVLPAELAELSAGVRNAHGQLAAARDRERALEVSRRELVAWVSHDLRTPLAGLRAMSEALEDGIITDWPTISRYHRQIREETDRLALMIDDLFELSRIHAGALRLSLRAADLGDLIDEALTRAEPLAQAKELRLRGPAGPGIAVEVDAAEVGRALLNLVVNAIRHTPAGGVVEVLAGREPGMAAVTVADSCGGIPAEHLSRVFDVGFRGETARTPAVGEGAGLGLSIARGIVEAHCGQVTVRNAGRGCEFVIRLPLASGTASRTPRLGLTAGSTRAPRAVSPVTGPGG
jgi:signal transduction histidine kinase